MSDKTSNINRSQKKFKMIAVDENNYDALRDLGRTPDSFNDVISKMLRLLIKHGEIKDIGVKG